MAIKPLPTGLSIECFHRFVCPVFTPYFRTWIRAKPGLGNLDNLVNAFRTPPLPGKKIEFSVASALIPDIPASEMHGKNKWSKSMFPLVKHGEEYRVVESVSSEFKQD
ncbi:hypothetical protein V6N12_074146 [Hibiscus sabdariffa]|uniref:Uncharacterized protein n=1 Tax=Hibiscus sabdariffa TaxID=183260 RepID=A0ABR2BI12_9ROSI